MQPDHTKYFKTAVVASSLGAKYYEDITGGPTDEILN